MEESLKNSSKTVAKNTLFNSLSGIVVQALAIISGVFIARQFGTSGFGKLAFANVFVGYFMLATDFGITSIAIRNMARDKENSNRFLFTYIITRVVLSLIIYGIVAIIVWLAGFEKIISLLILAYALQMLSQVFNISWVFIAHQRMEFDSLIKIIDKGLYVTFIFALFFIFGSIFIVPLAMFFSSVIAVIVGWHILKKNWRFKGFEFDKPFFKEMLIYGWPVGLSNGATQVNVNIDTLFMTAYHGNVTTGLYSSAYRVVMALIMFGSFFTAALYPLICERAIGPKKPMEDILNASTKILLYALIPIAVVITILGSQIIVFIFGKEFSGGGIALKILIWSVVFLVINRMYGNTLVALNRQHSFMVVIILSAILNIIMNFLLIPKYDMVGGGISTCITEGFIFIAVSYILKSYYRISWLLPLMRAFISSLVMGICLYFMRNGNLALLLISAPILYLIPLFVIGGIGREEIAFMRGLVRKAVPES